MAGQLRMSLDSPRSSVHPTANNHLPTSIVTVRHQPASVPVKHNASRWKTLDNDRQRPVRCLNFTSTPEHHTSRACAC